MHQSPTLQQIDEFLADIAAADSQTIAAVNAMTAAVQAATSKQSAFGWRLLWNSALLPAIVARCIVATRGFPTFFTWQLLKATFAHPLHRRIVALQTINAPIAAKTAEASTVNDETAHEALPLFGEWSGFGPWFTQRLAVECAGALLVTYAANSATETAAFVGVRAAVCLLTLPLDVAWTRAVSGCTQNLSVGDEESVSMFTMPNLLVAVACIAAEACADVLPAFLFRTLFPQSAAVPNFAWRIATFLASETCVVAGVAMRVFFSTIRRRLTVCEGGNSSPNGASASRSVRRCLHVTPWTRVITLAYAGYSAEAAVSHAELHLLPRLLAS